MRFISAINVLTVMRSVLRGIFCGKWGKQMDKGFQLVFLVHFDDFGTVYFGYISMAQVSVW